MTDWKRVRDEAASAFVNNYQTMNGRSPHRPDVVQFCFQAGYDYAIANDQRVKALVEAMKKWADEYGDNHTIAREALKAFEGSGE